jgi:hypothetical protein
MIDYRTLSNTIEIDFNKAVDKSGVVVSISTPDDLEEDFIGVTFYRAEDAEINSAGLVAAASGFSPVLAKKTKQRLFSQIKHSTGLEARII